MCPRHLYHLWGGDVGTATAHTIRHELLDVFNGGVSLPVRGNAYPKSLYSPKQINCAYNCKETSTIVTLGAIDAVLLGKGRSHWRGSREGCMRQKSLCMHDGNKIPVQHHANPDGKRPAIRWTLMAFNRSINSQ